MAFEYLPGATTVDEIVTSISDIMSSLAHEWSLIYENPASTSFNLNTTTGVEATSNRVVVLRRKLSHNTVGTSDDEYTYAIIEGDTSNNRILVRCCTSFSSGGVNVDVTPTADAITNGSLTNVLASHAVGISTSDYGVGIGLDNGTSIESVVIVPVDHVLGAGHADENQFYAMHKAGTASCWVPTAGSYTGKQMPVAEVTGDAADITSDGSVFTLLSPLVISDADELMGVMLSTYVSVGSTAVAYDRLNILNEGLTPDRHRVFEHGSGIIAVRDT